MSEAKITVTAEDLASEILKKVREEVKGVGDQTTESGHQGSNFGDTLKSAFENPMDAAKNLGGELKSNLLAGLGEYGLAVGAAVTVTAFLVIGMTELAEHARIAGGEINKMAVTTGISVASVSQLRFAAEAAGGSLDDVSRATFMFEQRMENSSKKVDEGLKLIGLSVDELKGMNKDQWLLAISDGFRQTGEDTNKAAAAMDIFGRQGREMLPFLLKDLSALVDKSHEAGAVWSDEDVAATKKFTGELNLLKASTNAAWIELGLHVSIAEEISYGYNRMKLAAANVALTMWDIVSVGGYVRATWDTLLEQEDKFPRVAGSATDALKKQNEEISKRAGGPLLMSLADEHDMERQLTIEAEKAIAANKAREKAAKEAAAAEKEFIKDALHDFHESEKETEDAGKAIAKAFGGGLNVLKQLSIQMGDTRMEAKQIPETLMFAMPDASEVVRREMRDLRDQVFTDWSTGFDDLFGTALPRAVLSAVEGGGNVWSSAGHLIGQQLGSNMDQMLTQHFTDSGGALGKLFSGGGLLSGIVSGGLSTAIGVGMSFLTKGIGALMNIGGPDKQELEGRKVEGDFQKQFGSFDQMMKAVGSAYDATGRSAKQAQDDVKALMAAEKQGGDAAKAAADKINSAFSDQKQDASDLQAALNEYHFSIEELGPALQKQQLGEQASKIMNQFRLLVGAGVDVTAVEDKMSGNINAYLQAVIKTGQEVPAAMKPMLEKMAEQGKLTDENGDKISDLKDAGVTFAETMSDAADRIVKGFNDVLTKIGLIPAAAQDASKKIPQNPFRDWIPPQFDPNDYGIPPGMSTGGWVTNTGIQYFGNGGTVLPRNGTDTVPAMLSPDEMVFTPSQQNAIRSLIGRVPSTSNAATDAKLDRLHRTMEGIRGDFQALPVMMRHAMRGTR